MNKEKNNYYKLPTKDKEKKETAFKQLNPKNKKEMEKVQKDVNKIREKIVSKLPPSDKKKFKAIEKAVKILCDNNIYFYLFPLLPSEKGGDKEIVWQWNSLGHLAEINKDGSYTEESRTQNALFHAAFFSCFAALFKDKSHYETFEEMCKNMGHKIFWNANKFAEYYNSDKDFSLEELNKPNNNLGKDKNNE